MEHVFFFLSYPHPQNRLPIHLSVFCDSHQHCWTSRVFLARFVGYLLFCRDHHPCEYTLNRAITSRFLGTRYQGHGYSKRVRAWQAARMIHAGSGTPSYEFLAALTKEERLGNRFHEGSSFTRLRSRMAYIHEPR